LIRESFKAVAPLSACTAHVNYCDPILERALCVWVQGESHMATSQQCCGEEEAHASEGWFANCVCGPRI